MWETTFLIAVWLTITPPTGFVTDSTSIMLLEFNESMSMAGLFDENNYTIIDGENNPVPIYRIGIVDTIDGINIPDTSLIALLIPKAKFKREYITTVNNLVDKNGRELNINKNFGWFFNNGFAPNLIDNPNVKLK